MSKIKNIIKAVDATDGAGVKLKRVFGFYEKEQFDPFLLLDHIKTKNPKTGFPWHPHRGIETISYAIKGTIYHEDSLGNKGKLSDGDIQWMKSGSGILHQEIPEEKSDEFEMLQFWLNIPQADKMSKPEYVYMNVDGDTQINKDNLHVSVIAGNYFDVKGPVQKEDRDIRMLYVDMDNTDFEISLMSNTNAFMYVLGGSGNIDDDSIEEYHVYQLEQGNEIVVQSNSQLKFVLVEGKPLHEPIAWYGPIVMNTKEEIALARKELSEGTFIKE